MLYKYRDFTNLQFALDIFVHSRMFASTFEKLNDPMEGSYRYEKGLLAPYQVEAIYGEKNMWHLLSLSATHDNLLVWSHYAAGHSGMVIGLDLVDTDAQIETVDYVKDLTVKKHTADIARRILKRKFDLWEYEKEVRVFKRNEHGQDGRTFVGIKVREVIFGTRTDESIKVLVSSIAKNFCPGVKIRTIKRAELKTGRGAVDV